jgi:uncharacterized protein
LVIRSSYQNNYASKRVEVPSVKRVGSDHCVAQLVGRVLRCVLVRRIGVGLRVPHDHREPGSIVSTAGCSPTKTGLLVVEVRLRSSVCSDEVGRRTLSAQTICHDLDHDRKATLPTVSAPDWARPIVHVEIEALDPERQRAFYSAMFNWDIGSGPIMSFDAGPGAPDAGPGGHIRGGSSSRVTLYIQVRDLAESLTKATELGGTVILEHLQVPGGATLAAITDPEGNPITLVQQ